MLPVTSSSNAAIHQQSAGQNVETKDSQSQKCDNTQSKVKDEIKKEEEPGKKQQQVSGNPKKELTPIIEVKKPPTPAEGWDDNASIATSFSTASPKPSLAGESKTNQLENENALSVGDSVLDSNVSTNSELTKTKRPPSRDSNNSSSYNAKGLKSNIPRFARNVMERTVGDKCQGDRRPFGGISRIPKSNMPAKAALPPLPGFNASRRSTPNRSHASSFSSRGMSPAIGSPVASKTPDSADVQGNKQKEIHNLLEEMYTTVNRIKEDEPFDSKEKVVGGAMTKKHPLKKPMNYVMPAKDGAGETYIRHNTRTEGSEKLCSLETKMLADIDVGATRAELFHYLSDLSEVSQGNMREFRKIIKIEASDSKQAEIQFFKVEQSQMELIQKLIKGLTVFYDDREKMQQLISQLSSKQNELLPNVEEKLALLEAENTSLTDKVTRLSHLLDEERALSQKRKVSSQVMTQTKTRMQKAEARQMQLERKLLDLSSLTKKIEGSLRQKENIVENNSKKIKDAETTILELETVNSKLKAELEDVKSREETKYSDLIQNSQELKDAKVELMTLQERLNDEVERRDKQTVKLQDTTSRLKNMEEKCKSLASLVDNAKAEVKMKDIESGEKEKHFIEEISQLHTELQARKVMLKVAEDDVMQIKHKLERIEVQAKQEHQKEKNASENEDQLKMELAIRDEQITQLQEQIKSLIEKKFTVTRESQSRSKNKVGGKSGDKQSGNNFSEKIALTAQVVDMERTIDSLAKDNLQLNQILNQKNLELDQRDRIVKMQTDVLKIRDELIWLLKSKEGKHEEDIKRLNDDIQEREHTIAKVMASIKQNRNETKQNNINRNKHYDQ